MKKILATMLLALSASAFAGSATIEFQDQDGKGGSPTQNTLALTVRENITKNLVGDVAISGTQTDGTKAFGSRIEGGVTGNYAVAGLGLYTRLALGEKYSNGANSSYYSVEPGVKAPIGKTGLTAQLGYRYRTAFDSSVADTTRTVRAGLAYALTKNDTIGVRYDQMRGDTKQNVVAVNYTRGF